MNNEIFTEADLIFSYDIEILYKDAQENSDLQIKQISDLINQNIDVLMVSPNESEPLTTVIEEVKAKGIPVVIIDRTINSDSFDTFIGGNNLMVGRLAGLLSLSKLQPEKRDDLKILSITGLIGSSPAQERQMGFEEILRNANISTDVLNADWKRNTAYRKLDSLIKKTTINYDLVFAHNDEMAAAASDVFARYNENPVVIGVDGLATPDGGLELILNNKIEGTISYPPSGDKALRLAIDLVSGKEVKKYNYQNTFSIDDRNAESLYYEALRVKEQRAKLRSLITSYDSLSLDIEEKNQVILWISIMSGLLLLSVGISVNSIIQKTKVNKLLNSKQRVINQQNIEIGSNRDQLISAIKQMEEMGELKTQFFSNISHEFKNLIALMSLDIDKVIADSSTKSRLKHYLSMVNSNLNRLLTYENLNSQDYPIELKYGDLGKVVSKIAEDFRFAIEGKKINYIVDWEPVFTEFDADVVQKVLSNLISNALKYTQKGQIKVKLKHTDEIISIDVEDTGIGIPSNELNKIFERYERSSLVNSQKNSYGIGLHFCKSLINLMQGDISLESELNVGSKFSITLPLKPEDQSYKEFNKESDFDKDKQTILVAEDNPRILARIHKILKKEYNVITSNNGLDAYKLVNYHQPDLIISDILMPGLDGIQLSQKLFDNPATIHIPIILLTAVQGEGIRAKGYETGADAFLTKPFSQDTLKARVKNLIEKSKKINFGTASLEPIKTKSELDRTFLKQIEDFLYEHISDSNFKLEELHAETGMSRSKFYRKVKSLTSLSPNDHIRKLRLNYASQILLKTDFSISEVAYKVGFSDVKYFTRLFKSEYNQTPTDYKKSFTEA